MKVSKKRLFEIIDNFKDKRILIFGDLILDRYIMGNIERISREAPVPIVKVKREDYKPGGAGNVALNIKSLSADSYLIAFTGQDGFSKHFKNFFNENNAKIFESKSNKTIVKSRIMSQNQQLIRIDREENVYISDKEMNELKELIEGIKAEAIILSDYSTGAINPKTIKIFKQKAIADDVLLLLDPKPNHYDIYGKGFTAITPNKSEAESIVNFKIESDQDAKKAIKIIQKRFKTKYTILTRGEKGITAFEKGKKIFTIPSYSHEIYDVTGAGDTVASVLLLSLCSNASMKEAVILSNLAASIVIEKIGASQCTTEELKRRINDLYKNK